MTAAKATVPLLATAAILAGCEGPLSVLDPASTTARTTAGLWWGMFGWFTLVLTGVMALWLFAVHRSHRDGERDCERSSTSIRESARGGNRWILLGGILLPLVTVSVVLLFGIPAGHRMLPSPDDNPVVIEVTGHQWWWQVRYPEADIETANHLVMPAGQPVHLHLRTGDVIHSFWVPRLAGKLDMIPGRLHVLALEADEPGIYRAQCAEFCGAQHARMQMQIEALAPAAYAQWLSRRQTQQIQAPVEATLAPFQQHCGECHRVAGITPGGLGPDLSDLAARPTLGAGTVELAGAASIERWLLEHQQLKPGNRMPEHANLTDDELGAIASWLATLAPHTDDSAAEAQ